MLRKAWLLVGLLAALLAACSSGPDLRNLEIGIEDITGQASVTFADGMSTETIDFKRSSACGQFPRPWNGVIGEGQLCYPVTLSGPWIEKIYGKPTIDVEFVGKVFWDSESGNLFSVDIAVPREETAVPLEEIARKGPIFNINRIHIEVNSARTSKEFTEVLLQGPVKGSFQDISTDDFRRVRGRLIAILTDSALYEQIREYHPSLPPLSSTDLQDLANLLIEDYARDPGPELRVCTLESNRLCATGIIGKGNITGQVEIKVWPNDRHP